MVTKVYLYILSCKIKLCKAFKNYYLPLVLVMRYANLLDSRPTWCDKLNNKQCLAIKHSRTKMVEVVIRLV